LRTILRAHRELVPELASRKNLRRMQKVARVTSSARDTEVLAAHVRPQRARMHARERAGVDWMLQRLRADTPPQHRIAKRLRRLSRAIERASAAAEAGAGAPSKTLAEVMIESVADLREKLILVLAEPGLPDHPKRLHRARVLVKRIRYLVEPIEPILPSGSGLLALLKETQDQLGTLNDTIVMRASVGAVVAVAAAERARASFEAQASAQPSKLPFDPRPGLLRLSRHLEAERKHLAAAFVRARPTLIAQLQAELQALDEALSRAPGSPNDPHGTTTRH
jgi:CHAD domain-containing protein